MQHNFIIKGIKCGSCIGKISNLLQENLSIEHISFTNNNTKLNFASKNHITLETINSLLATLGDYHIIPDKASLDKKLITPNFNQGSYQPIYLIFFYLIITNLVICQKFTSFALFMPNFMASFFLVFSFFKLLDLTGFANSYSMYDIVAKKFSIYAYIYPFIELCFGILYLIIPSNIILNVSVFIIMSVSTIGVIKSKLTKQKFECACVGTFLKVPLGNVAIIEDLLMVIMSLMMLIQLI